MRHHDVPLSDETEQGRTETAARFNLTVSVLGEHNSGRYSRLFSPQQRGA